MEEPSFWESREASEILGQFAPKESEKVREFDAKQFISNHVNENATRINSICGYLKDSRWVAKVQLLDINVGLAQVAVNKIEKHCPLRGERMFI